MLQELFSIISNQPFEALSIVAAFVTFVVGYISTKRTWRRNNTLDAIKSVLEQEPLARSHKDMAFWIATREPLETDELDEYEQEVVLRMLEYYSFLSISAMSGSLDLAVLRKHRGVAMRDTLYFCKGYIDARRKRLKRPKLYCDYEEFVEKYVPQRDYG